MFTIVFLTLAVAGLAAAAPASTQDKPAEAAAGKAKNIATSPVDLYLIDVGTVSQIVRSDQIELDGKRSYKLDNIRIPAYYTNDALEYLQKNFLNKKVGIYSEYPKDETAETGGQNSIDRYGGMPAQVLREDGRWVQADLLSEGLAWAFSLPTSTILIRALYKYENAARNAKRGFWQIPSLAVKNEQTITGTENSFQLYEGTVLSANTVNQIKYLNFGPDWKKDFTLVIDPADQKGFDQAAGTLIDFAAYVGHRIRVRGWVEARNGPMMHLTHPQQIEILDAQSPPPPSASSAK